MNRHLALVPAAALALALGVSCERDRVSGLERDDFSRAAGASSSGAEQENPSARRRLGYSTAASDRQVSLERRFRDAVSTDRLSAFHAALTKQPHLSGTPGALAVTDYLKKALADAGLDVDVFEYRAYLSFPKSIAVDFVAPVAQSLSVTEPPTDVDQDTKRSDLLPGFIAYSASGDVTAPVVYVNYGLPPDYAQLAARGVDVRGRSSSRATAEATAP